MRRPQFSLATLGAIVAYCAIACSALISASETWSSVLFTAAVIYLTSAVALCIYRSGATRAFWLGNALFGWVYLVIIFWPSSERIQFGEWYKMELGTELVTSRLARWAYSHVLPHIRTPPSPPANYPLPGGGRGGGGGGFFSQFGGGAGNPGGLGGVTTPPPPPMMTYPEESTFVRVAHALFIWMFALLGGVLTRRLQAGRATIDLPAAK